MNIEDSLKVFSDLEGLSRSELEKMAELIKTFIGNKEASEDLRTMEAELEAYERRSVHTMEERKAHAELEKRYSEKTKQVREIKASADKETESKYKDLSSDDLKSEYLRIVTYLKIKDVIKDIIEDIIENTNGRFDEISKRMQYMQSLRSKKQEAYEHYKKEREDRIAKLTDDEENMQNYIKEADAKKAKGEEIDVATYERYKILLKDLPDNINSLQKPSQKEINAKDAVAYADKKISQLMEKIRRSKSRN